MKRYNSAFLLFFIMACAFLYFQQSHAGNEENPNPKNKPLGLTCVDAYWPISDELTSPFGIRYSSDDGYDFHEGIDIRAQSSLPVAAFADGTVHGKGTETSGAHFVRLRHQDPCGSTTFYTYYTHLTKDAVYDALNLNATVTGGSFFVNSGNSGNVPYHLHFAGLVGGISTRDDAINPMRDDSLPYFNSFPLGVTITNPDPQSFEFEIQTSGDELDLNEIELSVYDLFGVYFDGISMNFDTRKGVDHQSYSGENGDEDGDVIGTTDLRYLTIHYNLSANNFNPWDYAHTVKVRVTFPAGWNDVGSVMIVATDTQGLQAFTDIVVGIGKPDPPNVTPASGTYPSPLQVTMSASPGDEIYYTLDGSTPTTNSTRYYAPFTLTSLDYSGETWVVKAVTYNGADYSNEVVTRTYTVYNPCPPPQIFCGNMAFFLSTGDVSSNSVQLTWQDSLAAAEPQST